MIKQLMNFVQLIIEQTPTKDEFKTQTGKEIFKILFLILGILLCLILIGVVLGFYLLSFFLKVLGSILLLGAGADFVHIRWQDRHFEGNGRYF